MYRTCEMRRNWGGLEYVHAEVRCLRDSPGIARSYTPNCHRGRDRALSLVAAADHGRMGPKYQVCMRLSVRADHQASVVVQPSDRLIG